MKSETLAVSPIGESPRRHSSHRGLDLTGGESVFCISQRQMRQALDLFEARGPDDPLRLAFDDLTSRFTRNEQAALAFRLIEQLNRG
ncbi:MAG: hypothetical protein AB1714_17985 [Acidobacteriota bacterium]